MRDALAPDLDAALDAPCSGSPPPSHSSRASGVTVRFYVGDRTYEELFHMDLAWPPALAWTVWHPVLIDLSAYRMAMEPLLSALRITVAAQLLRRPPLPTV